jgi:NADH-quinone oxidoreductase subunit M
VLYFSFDNQTVRINLAKSADWITLPIGSLGIVSIDYAVAVDGISFPLVLLAVIVLLQA